MEICEYHCPLRGTLQVAGKKWGICVVGAIGRNGPLRFSALARCLRVGSPATLVSTLRALERAGFVRRAESAGSAAPKVEYALTPRGFALWQSTLNLEYWFGTGREVFEGWPRARTPRSPFG
jgi:DNA-binding HxlR family transcriptional regulator